MKIEYMLAFLGGVELMALANALSLGLLPCRLLALIFLGHGEKSLYIASKFIKLSDEEAAAIRWHMGAFDNAFRGGDRGLNAAYEKYPLAVLLHMADMRATYLV